MKPSDHCPRSEGFFLFCRPVPPLPLLRAPLAAPCPHA